MSTFDYYGSLSVQTEGFMLYHCPNHEPDFMGDLADEAIDRHDDGEILVGVSNGKVDFDYGESGLGVYLTPGSARKFAAALVEAAEYVECDGAQSGGNECSTSPGVEVDNLAYASGLFRRVKEKS